MALMKQHNQKGCNMTTIITSFEQSRNVRHVAGVMFKCGDCGQIKPVKTDCSTGYGWKDISPQSKPVCVECCAIEDRKIMSTTGKHSRLYYTGDKVTNWPGTLAFKVVSRKSSWHNFAGKNGRTDFWFVVDGYYWHGVNIGDNQLARCKKTKQKAGVFA